MKSKVMNSLRRLWPWLFATVWATAVLAGLNMIWRYANSPAAASEVRSQWPANALISLDANLPTLVMFVHPHCPCTRASIGELAKIAAQCKGRFDGQVVLFTPADFDDSWTETDLRESALEIPGMHVVVDRDGDLARLFHVTTSGHTLLFSPSGELMFSGGITGSRGHAGDNVGESAVIALLMGKPSEVSRTPVFGCPIVEDAP